LSVVDTEMAVESQFSRSGYALGLSRNLFLVLDPPESWLKAWASYLALIAEERVAVVAT
jgi:hypothetical protein